MSTEYSDAAVKSATTNPLWISNFFHLVVGSANLLAGGGLAFLLTKEAQLLQFGLFQGLSMAAILLVLGMTQIGRAWRDDKFRIHPDDIGSFKVAEKFINGKNHNVVGYIDDVFNNGIIPGKTPDNALLNKLYGWLPKLEFAPQVIRWHAETQALRIVKLVVATMGFVLAAIFAKSEIFAWMVPIYLFLVMQPVLVLRTLAHGAVGEQQLMRTKNPTPVSSVAVILFSIFAPIILSVLSESIFSAGFPVAPWSTATFAIPTVVAIVSLLFASALFVFSLKAQTRYLNTSGVGYKIRDDLNVSSLSDGLLDRLVSQLPFPMKILDREPGSGRRSEEGSFGGRLLVETEPKLEVVGGHASILQAINNARADREQRPLVALGALGMAVGVLATVAAFMYARSGSLTVLLTAFALFSASQFALFASRGLWNRLDFKSVIYNIKYKGSFQRAQRVAGNTMTGSGTLTESVVRIEHVEFFVSVAKLKSVSFSKGGRRYIQSVDLMEKECDHVFNLIEDFYQGVMGRRAEAYQEESRIRQLVQGDELQLGAEKLPNLLGQAAADEDDKTPNS